MICTKCGARLMDTDQFCPKCGARVIREKRCPDCGEVLRDGVRFCPGCGRAVGGKRSTAPVPDETLDIPIEAIEQNILSETAAEIKAEKSPAPAARRPVPKEQAPVRRAPSGSPGVKRKQEPVPAPAPRRKKPAYREEIPEDEDWEDDEDWDEDEDWDDEEEEGIDVITVMTVAVGCILLIVVAILGFHFYKQYVPKNYDKAAEEEQEQEEEGDAEEGQDPSGQAGEEAGGQETEAGTDGGGFKLTIVSNVNVRDEPSTSGTNVLKVAAAGETYVCNGSTEDGDWYQIELEDGTVGYVFHEYISIE